MTPRTSRALVATGAVAALLGVAADAGAWCRMTTSRRMPASIVDCITDGVPLYWDDRCIGYALDASASEDLGRSEVIRIVEESFAAWTALECPGGGSAGFEIRREAEPAHCGHAEYNTDDGNVNVITFVDDWDSRDYDTAAYAVTTVWHHTGTGEIYDVDMEINEQRGTYGVCPAPGGCTDGTIDLQNVITHEAGHFFGIAHTADENAVMFGLSEPGEVGKRLPRGDDIEGFCATYPPGSLPESCGFAPRGGLELDCSDGSCGCSVPGRPRDRDAGWLALAAVAGLVLVARRRRP